MKKLIAACFLLVSAPAMAADLGAGSYKDSGEVVQGGLIKWSGFYVGVDLGYGAASGDVNTTTTETWYNDDKKEPLSMTGLLGDITLGADYHIPSSKIIVGVFGDYTIGNVSGSVSESSSGGTEGGKFSIDNQWKLGLRAGVLLNPTTMAYAKFGYSQADLTVDHYATDGTGAAKEPSKTAVWNNPKLDGYVTGAGLETQLAGGLFVRAEYNYVAYGDNTVYTNNKPKDGGGKASTETSSVNLDEHIAKVGLVYKFGLGN